MCDPALGNLLVADCRAERALLIRRTVPGITALANPDRLFKNTIRLASAITFMSDQRKLIGNCQNKRLTLGSRLEIGRIYPATPHPTTPLENYPAGLCRRVLCQSCVLPISLNVRVVQFDALIHGEYILTFRLKNGDFREIFSKTFPLRHISLRSFLNTN